MRVLFCKSNRPVSVLIRAITWSPWSHVAIIDGEEVIEAVWGQGVRTTPLASVIAQHSAHAMVDLPCIDPMAAVAAARSQVGKPYDLSALFGLFMHRDWQRDDSWFCSELVAWSISQGGPQLFRTKELHRVTPQHLWMLAPLLLTPVSL